MKQKIIFLLITNWFCELFAVSWSSLPPEIQKCESTNNDECIGKAIESVFKLYPTGNNELGLPNISALNLTNLKVSRSNSNSPIQINFEFINCTVYGLEKIKVLKSLGFKKELKNIELETFSENIKLKGNYKISGKLLLLPLNGNGIGEINLKDTKLLVRLLLDMDHQNNKTHIKLKEVKGVVKPKLLKVNLKNILNGNPDLSKTINDVINENWQDVWSELQEGVNYALELILENLLSTVFETLTLEDMFLD